MSGGLILISEAAIAETLRKARARGAHLGRSVVPCFRYYRRSHSILEDGSTIEYGQGVFLSFIDEAEFDITQYVSIEAGNNKIILLYPPEFFRIGAHYIDWLDQEFVYLESKRARRETKEE